MMTTFSEPYRTPCKKTCLKTDFPVLRHACSMPEISDFSILQRRSHNTPNIFQYCRIHSTPKYFSTPAATQHSCVFSTPAATGHSQVFSTPAAAGHSQISFSQSHTSYSCMLFPMILRLQNAQIRSSQPVHSTVPCFSYMLRPAFETADRSFLFPQNPQSPSTAC